MPSCLPPIKDGAGNLLSPFGDATRNPGRGQAFYQTDLALNKRFSTPVESLKVEFRTEFYNIFNHTNFTIPGGISASQGTTTTVAGTGGAVPVSAITAAPSTNGQITSTLTPRVNIQFGPADRFYRFPCSDGCQDSISADAGLVQAAPVSTWI